MKVYYKSSGEIEKMRAANLVVAEILDRCEEAVAPGMTTWDFEELCRAEIERHRVKSAFLGYMEYPCVVCTSVNEVVVHGIPRKDVVLAEGDIFSVDFGAYKDDFCGDSARTVAVGKISPEAKRLVDVTRRALELGIEQARPGNRMHDIGAAIQNYVEDNGFSVVKQFVGHGIGRQMHEDPAVPNYGRRGRGVRLKPGLVIAIEPMVNAGTHEVEVLEDQWTAVTRDGQLSAHFEHSVAITEKGPVVLSRN